MRLRELGTVDWKGEWERETGEGILIERKDQFIKLVLFTDIIFFSYRERPLSRFDESVFKVRYS